MEVALAIGIIAVAFVALFALLPTGLTTFRNAIDETNSGRILEALTSRAQATEYDKVLTTFDFTRSGGLVYYFDEEGNFIRVGKSNFGELSAQEKLRAVYAAKLFGTNGWSGNATSLNAINLSVLFASVNSAAFTQFEAIGSQDAFRAQLAGGQLDRALRVRNMIIAKMDGKPSPAN